ncbi:ATP-dependent zinc metalloprotease FTSH 12, chloroplastic [Capsicum chinense]|nr:ATP-dependent zinc metalloprotease FTSH 12, chloroplastic [Capsicum chinense]
MKEVENSLRKDLIKKTSETQGTRALWISKRWWRYRPKLSYTYFLQKLDISEVAAIVFIKDLKQVFVTMKEGFPLECIVDIPLDHFLFEMISSSGAEVDLLQKRRILYKKYNQLFDMAYAKNFILPVGEVSETKSMYKEIVLGGDVWDLLDELMIYMGNPMQYYEKDVKFVRGVLLSGPPRTGKTLFAQTLAKESGIPFVFASDEIDVIVGRHTRKDPCRKATFESLITQLDGEKEKTGVDRFSLRQAFIFICATNQPDELDLEFFRTGRIDRLGYSGADIRNLFDWHAFSQLLPGGKETVVSVFYPREDVADQGYTTFSYMKIQIVVSHGEHCAERIVFGDDTTDGGTDDLEKITKIAREMVISPRSSRLGLTALTKRIGLADQPDSLDGEIIKYKWDDPHIISVDMTVEVFELFTRELTRYIDETEELAMRGLIANRHILDLISNELLERSRITGLEVEDKMRGLGLPCLKIL